MVIWLSMGQYRVNDHPYYARQFIQSLEPVFLFIPNMVSKNAARD